MKKYRLLCEDIIEHTADSLSMDVAVKVLRDRLLDLN